MSATEEKSPYFSTRVRVADIKSPKEFVGLKEMTVEVIFGNRDAIVITNRDDVAEVLDNKTIFDTIDDIYTQRDTWATKKGYLFLDQVIKPKAEDFPGAKP